MANVRYMRGANALRNANYTMVSKEREKKIIEATFQTFIEISVAVLIDGFDFDQQDVRNYQNCIDELVNSMENGVDDWRTISRNIKEFFEEDN